MRKLKNVVLGILAGSLVSVCMAMVVKYNAYLVNEAGLTYNKTYALPLNQYGVDYLSFTTIGSSATIAAVTVDMPAFTLNGKGIAGNNSFVTGLPALYSSTVTVGGLTTGTTYFVSQNNPNAFFVSRTSTDAVAGSYITFTSTTAGRGFTIRFSPLAIAGTPSFKWQISNDGINWIDYTATVANVAISSVSFASYNSTGTVNNWDFGVIDYAYIRLSVVSPTAGALRLQVIGNGKNSSN